MADGMATAVQLLDAGRRLFAAEGYEGASVRAIAAEADANIGAVNYHFGSKRRLYDAVVSLVLELLEERLAAAPAEPAALVEAVFDHLEAQPDTARLLARELAAGEALSAAGARSLGSCLARFRGALGERGAGPEGARLAAHLLFLPVQLELTEPLLGGSGEAAGTGARERRAAARRWTAALAGA